MEVRQMTMTLTTVHGPGSRVRRYLTKRICGRAFILFLRLPKTIVNQEICCRLVIALRISPGGFTLSSFVPFAFGLPSPIHLLVRRGPCTLVPYFPLWVQCAGFQVEMTMGRCHGHLLYLHFTHNHLLIACIADNWHLPSIWTNKVHMESMTRRTGHSQFLITSACRVKGEKCVTEPTLTSPLRKRGEAPLFRVKMRPQCMSIFPNLSHFKSLVLG